MGRQLRTQQHASRPEHPHRVGGRRVRSQDRRVGSEPTRRTSSGLPGSARRSYGNAVVSGGKVFVGTNNSGGWLKRYPVERRSGLPALLRPRDGQVSLAAQQRETAHGPRPRLAAAGHLLCAAGRRQPALVRHQPRRSSLPRYRRFLRRRERRSLRPKRSRSPAEGQKPTSIWVFRHDERTGRLAAQHVQLLGHRRRRHAVRQHLQRRRRRHINLPAPDAPSFIAMDKNTGKVLWTDNSPGTNILHGQWSSPAYAVLGGQPQVIFAGGDGWVYSFDPQGDGSERQASQNCCGSSTPTPRRRSGTSAGAARATTSSPRR